MPQGYFLASFLFMAMVFSLPICLGLAAVALDLPVRFPFCLSHYCGKKLLPLQLEHNKLENGTLLDCLADCLGAACMHACQHSST